MKSLVHIFIIVFVALHPFTRQLLTECSRHGRRLMPLTRDRWVCDGPPDPSWSSRRGPVPCTSEPPAQHRSSLAEAPKSWAGVGSWPSTHRPLARPRCELRGCRSPRPEHAVRDGGRVSLPVGGRAPTAPLPLGPCGVRGASGEEAVSSLGAPPSFKGSRGLPRGVSPRGRPFLQAFVKTTVTPTKFLFRSAGGGTDPSRARGRRTRVGAVQGCRDGVCGGPRWQGLASGAGIVLVEDASQRVPTRVRAGGGGCEHAPLSDTPRRVCWPRRDGVQGLATAHDLAQNLAVPCGAMTTRGREGRQHVGATDAGVRVGTRGPDLSPRDRGRRQPGLRGGNAVSLSLF